MTKTVLDFSGVDLNEFDDAEVSGDSQNLALDFSGINLDELPDVEAPPLPKIPDANPDEAAKVLDLAKTTGRSKDMVNANIPAAEKSVARNELYRLLEKNPGMLLHFQNKENAAISKDDGSALSTMELIASGMHGGELATGAEKTSAFGHFFHRLKAWPAVIATGNVAETRRYDPQNAEDRAAFERSLNGVDRTELARRREAARREFPSLSPDVIAAQAVEDMLKERGEYWQSVADTEAFEIPEEYENPQDFIDQVAAAFGGSLPDMMVTAANPAAGVLTMANTLYGHKYAELLRKGVDPKDAERAAFVDALGEMPLEYAGNLIQLGAITKALKGGTGRYFKSLLEAGTSEAIEEYLQNAPSLFADIMAENPEWGEAELIQEFVRQLPDAVTSDAWIESAIIGGTVGLILPGSLGGLKLMSDTQLEKQQLEFQERVNAMKAAIDTSLTRERSEVVTRRFLESIRETHGTIKNLYVSAPAMRNALFHDTEMTAEEMESLLESMGVEPSAYYEAEQMGLDVSIPLDDALINLTPEQWSALQPEMKASPVHLTAQEQEEIDAEYAESRLRNLDELYSETPDGRSLERVQRLAGELRAINLELYENETDALAAVMPLEARARVIEETLGVPVDDTYKRWGVEFIKGEQATEQPAGDTMMQEAGDVVDSPEFIEWSGGSRVVKHGETFEHEAGEPITVGVWHGTGAEVDEDFAFDYDKVGVAHGRSEGQGFYLTNKKEVAEGYLPETGGSLVKAYITFRKPLEYSAPAFDEETSRAILARAAEIEAELNELDIEDTFLANYGDARYEGLESVIDAAAADFATEETALDQMGSLVGAGVEVQVVNRAITDVTGYDGVITKGYSDKGDADKSIFVAFHPEQIKSAENVGTFDPQDPRILYQQDLGFFSPLEKAVEGFDFKAMPPAQLIQRIKKTPGVKQEELDDLGMFDWLEGVEGKVSKEDVIAFIQQGGPQFEEVTLTDAVEGVSLSENEEARRRELEDVVIEGGELTEAEQTESDALEARVTQTFEHAGTKYAGYQLEGGENYREVLMTLPHVGAQYREGESDIFVNGELWAEGVPNEEVAEQREFASEEGRVDVRPALDVTRMPQRYRSSHWQQPNVVAHLRLSDRVTEDGKRLLHVEEIQSDWHQEGRKKGYKTGSYDEARANHERVLMKMLNALDITERPINGSAEMRDAMKRAFTEAPAEFQAYLASGRQLKAAETELGTVPDAPFKKSWPMMAFKRALRMAAEQGYDSVVWTGGDLQAERYDLSKQVSEVAYNNTSQFLRVLDLNGNEIVNEKTAPEKLPDVVGKEVAEKLVTGGFVQLRDVDLKVGGEGMRGFYDRMLPKEVQKYAKKLDKAARLETTNVPTTPSGFYKLVRFDDGTLVDQTAVYESFDEAEEQRKEWAQALGTAVMVVEPDTDVEVWSLPITDKMRSKILEGQPLYQAQRSGPRGYIDWHSGKTFIALFESANLATVLHETGHHFLEDMRWMAVQPEAPQWAKDDVKSVDQWFIDNASQIKSELESERKRTEKQLEKQRKELGYAKGEHKLALSESIATNEQAVAELSAALAYIGDDTTVIESILRNEILNTPANRLVRRNAHEMFARGFEQYLMEGNAPSPELIPVFRRFQRWLSAIYVRVKALRSPVTDDVRRVFDRLLATEEQVKAASAFYELTASIDPQALDMSDPQVAEAYAEYESMRQRAEASAMETLNKEQVRAYGKKLKGWRKEARDAVDSDPEQAVLAWLRKVHINRDMVKEFYGETYKDLDAQHRGLLHRDGLAPDEVVAEANNIFGTSFEDGDDLIQRLTSIPKRSQWIENYVDALATMDEAFAPGDVVFNEDYERLLELEARMFQKDVRTVSWRALKQAADRMETTKRVEDLPEHGRVLKAGIARMSSRVTDMVEEEQDKFTRYRERVAAYRANREAREFVEKTRRYFKRLVGSGTIDADYRAKIAELLEGYDLHYRSAKTLKRRESLQEWVNRFVQEHPDDPMPIPARTLQDMNKKSMNDITLEELQDLRESVTFLAHLGRTKSKLQLAKEERELSEVIETVVSTIEANTPDVDLPQRPLLPSEEDTIRKPFKKRIGAKMNELVAPLRKVEFIINEMDGHEDLGPVHQAIFQIAVEAEEAELELGEYITAKLVAALSPYQGKVGAEMRTKRVQLKGVERMMTKEEMLVAALNMGNDGNMAALREGWLLSDAEIEAIKSTMAKEDWQVVQDIWSAINELYVPFNAAYKALTGISLKKVEGMPVATPYGVIQGQYFPLIWDSERSFLGQDIQNKQDAQSLMQQFYTSNAKVTAGATHTRKGGKLPQKLSLDVIFKHTAEVVHYSTHAVAVRNLQKIIKNNDFRKAVTTRMGKPIYKEFQEWLTHIAKPSIPAQSKWEAALRFLRNSTTVNALGLSVQVALVQPASILQVVEALEENAGTSLVRIMKAQGRLMSNWKGTVELVNSKSIAMRNRGRNWNRDMRDAYGKTEYIKLFGKSVNRQRLAQAQDAAFWMIGIGDIVGSYPAWLTGYEYAIEKGMSDKEAVTYADMIVRTTQPSAAPKDLVTVQRKSELHKLLTMFYTFFSVFGNRMMNVPKRYKGDPMGLFKALAFLWWIPAALIDNIKRLLKEQRFSSLPENLAAQISYLTAFIPVVRDVTSGFLTDFGYSFTPSTAPMEATIRLGKSIEKSIAGEKAEDRAKGRYKAAKYSVEMVGYGAGLPTRAMWTPIEGLYKLSTGKTKNPMALIMRVPDTPKSRR